MCCHFFIYQQCVNSQVLELVTNAVSSESNYKSIKPIRSQSIEYELLKAPHRTFLNSNSSSSKQQLIIYNLPKSLTEYLSTSSQEEVTYVKSCLYNSLRQSDSTSTTKPIIVITYDSTSNTFLGLSSSNNNGNNIDSLLSTQQHQLASATLSSLSKLDTEASSQLFTSSSKEEAGDTVIVLGSGGREHAISVALSNSPLISKIIVCPGNGGTSSEGGKIVNSSTSYGISKCDNESVVELVKKSSAHMVVVGPEQPLVDGVVDVLAKECATVKVFGPSMAGAELEASKV